MNGVKRAAGQVLLPTDPSASAAQPIGTGGSASVRVSSRSYPAQNATTRRASICANEGRDVVALDVCPAASAGARG